MSKTLTARQQTALDRIVAEYEEDALGFSPEGFVVATGDHGSDAVIGALIRKGALQVVDTLFVRFEVQRDFGRDAPRTAHQTALCVRPAQQVSNSGRRP